MDCTPVFDFQFNCLSNTELIQFVNYFDIKSSTYDLNQVLQFRNLPSSLDDDSGLDSGANSYLHENKSKFITTEEISQLQIFPDSLSVLQINCRSLSKNFEQLKNLLNNFNKKPSLISLSERWIKPSDNVSIFALCGYNFVSTPRKHKRGGGSGLFISNVYLI